MSEMGNRIDNQNEIKYKVDAPKRMSRWWVFFLIIKSFRSIIIPLVITIFANGWEDFDFLTLLVIGIILFILFRTILAFLSWWNFKYVFTDDELQITEGRFVKQQRSISLDRIQSIQQNTTIFHRLFKLTTLSFQTAAQGDESTHKLEMVSIKEANRIKDHINDVKEKDRQEIEEEAEGEFTLAPSKHYEMSPKDIFFATLTSVSLFAIIPVMLTVINQVDDFLNLEKYSKALLNALENSMFIIAVLGVFLFILAIPIGFLTMYFRYGHYRVTSDEKRIYIKKGILNQTEFTISKEKVNGIVFKKTFIRRWFGLVEVDLVSTGELEQDKVETDLLFPFIGEKRARLLIPEILPSFTTGLTKEKLPKKSLLIKLIRPSYLWMISTGALLYFWIDFWFISLILFVLIVLLRIMSYVQSYHGLENPFIELQSGMFSIERFATKHRKIDMIAMKESWLQRRFGLVTLIVSVRSKPVHHATITDIPKEAAMRYYQWYGKR